jgi:hypothetical protein
MAVKKSATDNNIQIHELKQGEVKLRMIGQTPLYFNSMGSKAMRDLLAGSRKKTAADKQNIKHNPEVEYRETMYTKKDGDTALYFPAAGVKGAMATAALETEGIKKTSVQRLIFLPQSNIQIWGKPYMKMDIVRSADMNRTPDVRTRAYLPEWCSEITIRYVTPTLSKNGIISLLANAGQIVGIGDFRQEKGRGSFGTWTVASAEKMSDWQQETWDRITAQSREVQELAIEYPEYADQETADLMDFMHEERERRAA